MYPIRVYENGILSFFARRGDKYYFVEEDLNKGGIGIYENENKTVIVTQSVYGEGLGESGQKAQRLAIQKDSGEESIIAESRRSLKGEFTDLEFIRFTGESERFIEYTETDDMVFTYVYDTQENNHLAIDSNIKYIDSFIADDMYVVCGVEYAIVYSLVSQETLQEYTFEKGVTACSEKNGKLNVIYVDNTTEFFDLGDAIIDYKRMF